MKNVLYKICLLLCITTGLRGNWTDAEKLLFQGIMSVDYAKVKDALSRGANVNAADNFDVTMLMRAAQRNNLTLVKWLLYLGANPAIGNKQGKKPVDLAQDPTVKALLQNPSTLDQHLTDEDYYHLKHIVLERMRPSEMGFGGMTRS